MTMRCYRAWWGNVARSFTNDVLLAMSCREAGIVLVTSNLADFTRIASGQRNS
jgi:predicted nucleic acid-binding protein